MIKRAILFVLSSVFILLLAACQEIPTDKQKEQGFWVRSESYFVDYTVNGDKVCFSYSFCFQNLSEYDIRSNGFIVSFRKRDLKGWIKYEKNFHGDLINGDKDVLIPAGEKMNIVLVFEGEYLGGDVNEEVYVKNILMGQRLEPDKE